MIAPIAELREFVEKNKHEMLLFWENLVNLQAGSYEVDKVNRVIDFLKKHFEAEGIDCHLLDTKGSANMLVAELNKDVAKAPILLSGHCDTVFPSGSYEENTFYIKDGFAHGPGVVDMKNGIAQIFYIMVALKHFGYTERPVKVLIVGDEENSHGQGIADELLMQERRGDLCCFNM